MHSTTRQLFKSKTTKDSLILVLLLSLIFITKTYAEEKKSFELPRINVIPIQDSQSKRQYELYIKLPEDYSQNNDKKYPVIYFTDAVWHIELLSAATAFLMEDVILVGISWQKNIEQDLEQEYGAHASRFTDYSFWKKSNPEHPKLQFGQANNHLTFIRNDVFTYIENTYRTDPNNRSYFGYSLGGLFGAYTLLTQPDTYKNYILGSPSVQLLTEGESKVEPKNNNLNANVLITHGDLEKESGEHIKAFVASLKKGNRKNLSIKYVVIEGDHQTAFPLTGIRSVTWLSELKREESKQ